MNRILTLFALSCALFIAASASAFAADLLPEGIVNTQPPGDPPPTPEQAAAMIKAPEGFRVTLFAGDPAVAQPISLTFDDRGRLWVAECYSYPQWNGPPRDRISIFEDVDHDGKHDKRTIFKDGLNNLTSIQLGFGGVWAIASPNLLFFPDANGDDKPDAEPTILLDGFDLKKIGHNIANGLTWGPDGWLYACHGILSESKLGAPGTPDEKRVKINCGVWRYHPTRKVVEVVCHGTTNPWGLDFDEEGDAFFINCVIGHLWQMHYGAYYDRMYGEHYRTHLYELIGSCSDHLHWGGGHWTESRGGQGVHSEAGGGHAHCGLVIYKGNNFPEKYRGVALMGNLHGNRINCDRLKQVGSCKVASHQPDFLTSTNPWFRPTALAVGPDGGLYIADWCDLGECHDNDGVHRTSGRIYKVRFGSPGEKIEPIDWAKLKPLELAQRCVTDPNDWVRRRARLCIQEQTAAGKEMTQVKGFLQGFATPADDEKTWIRALCGMWAAGETEEYLEMMSYADSPALAVQALRLLGGSASLAKDSENAFFARRTTSSPQTLLALASVLQKLPIEKRLASAVTIVWAEKLDDADKCLPQMIWYALEPAVAADPDGALALMSHCKSKKLITWTARRIITADPKKGLAAIVAALSVRTTPPMTQLALIEGAQQALRGQRGIVPPAAAWSDAYSWLSESKDLQVRAAADDLAMTLGDAKVIARLKTELADPKVDVAIRRHAAERLSARREAGLVEILLPRLGEPDMRLAALRGLAVYDDAKIVPAVLAVYKELKLGERAAALDLLSSRKAPALALLAAVDARTIAASDISAYHVRQMMNLNDAQVTEQLNRVWGTVRPSNAERVALIAKYKELLAPAALSGADSSRGRVIFTKTCGQCHKLFGEGGTLGPELTGSNRANLDYILENVLDPSAKIGRGYEMAVIELKDGRVLTGLATTRDENSINLQTASQTLVIANADIERRETSKGSLMPEGVWDKLEIGEVRDLVLYLQAKDQVTLPDKK